MGLFNIFKRKGPPKQVTAQEKVKAVEKTLAELKKEEGKLEKKAAVVAAPVAKEDTGNAFRILLRPVVTEKSAILADSGQYVFEVAAGANKIEIARAVKKVYGFTPVRVNLVKLPGREVVLRYRRQVKGKTKVRRKAIVTLKKGQKIALFEGV